MTDSPGGCYVILHVGNAPSPGTENPSPLVVRDGSTRFDLSDDIWIEKLGKLAPKIQGACDAPHCNYDPNTLPHNYLYAFVRRVPTDGSSQQEALEQLLGTVALSRLIHPTSTGDRYIARVLDFGRGDSQIEAIPTKGISPDVYPGSTCRDWLSVADAGKLYKLMPWLSGEKRRHPKVWRAIWNHEFAMRSGYFDVQWFTVVSGLEALISVGNLKLRRQFCARVQLLAAEFGINFTYEELWCAYVIRSKLAHSAGFLSNLVTILPENQHRSLYEKLESVLRRTVERCLLDEKFGNHFRDDKAVRDRWPTGLKPKEEDGNQADPCRSLAS